MGISYGLAMLLVFLALLLFSALRILREYERGVVFQLGRFWKVKGPGLVLVIPAIQQMVRIDLRTIVLDVPPQDVISRDNVSVKVNAVVYFRVLDPQKAIIQVENYLAATSQLAQTTLRAVLGKHELDEMLAERERLNLDIQQVLDAQTDAWGIKVANVEIKHVDLNESMVRAIAQQAEAERERRAKVIHAEGELQASEKLMQAAQMLGRQSGATGDHRAQARRLRLEFPAGTLVACPVRRAQRRLRHRPERLVRARPQPLRAVFPRLPEQPHSPAATQGAGYRVFPPERPASLPHRGRARLCLRARIRP